MAAGRFLVERGGGLAARAAGARRHGGARPNERVHEYLGSHPAWRAVKSPDQAQSGRRNYKAPDPGGPLKRRHTGKWEDE